MARSIEILLVVLFLLGCTPPPCKNQTVRTVGYKSCTFGKCREGELTVKLCEVEKLGNKCRYYSPEYGEYFWDNCFKEDE